MNHLSLKKWRGFMNFVVRQINEFTTWLLCNHWTQMRLAREHDDRMGRHRRQREERAVRRHREHARAVREPSFEERRRIETQRLLAEHRAWNAERSGGGVRHFG
jgi:acetyl-CoA acetyltransferase